MEAGSPPSVQLVELGPGRGTLTDDILRVSYSAVFILVIFILRPMKVFLNHYHVSTNILIYLLSRLKIYNSCDT